MAASSKPTDESSHPCGALSNHQDFDSMISDAKLTVDTGPDFYDRSLTSRRYALIGVAFSSIFSFSCIVAGIVILTNHGIMGVAMVISDIDHNQSLAQEILTLTLNFIVMLCTESTSLVHGISLRSALASESRLHFNTNLRLLTAARGWYNPNGALLNGISAVLLIVSYSSASLIVCPQYQTVQASGLAFIGLPLLILGVALLIQVMIALSGMRAVKILTWSSSPFDLTPTLVHHTQLAPVTFRCMRCVSDLDTFGGPTKPSEIQPSAWHALRKVVIFLWVVVAACAGWAALIMYFWDKYHTSMGFMSSYALTTQTWSFIPNMSGQSNFIAYIIPGLNLKLWILLFVNTAAIQGPLTLELHCSELIANVIRDERQWRCATEKKGLRTATNPVKTVFTHPICLVLFIAKPFLHWMFGLSFNIYNSADAGTLEPPFVHIYTAQIWNLCIALFIFACFLLSHCADRAVPSRLHMATSRRSPTSWMSGRL